MTPVDLVPALKKEFQYAVPDAKDTNEIWSTKPVNLIYLGHLIYNGNMIELSDHAKEVLQSKGLLEEAAFNATLLKKMGYKNLGNVKGRIGSDTFIHSKDDDHPSYHKKLTKAVNKNLDKGGYYRSKKHDTLKDPPAVGISLPKDMKG